MSSGIIITQDKSELSQILEQNILLSVLDGEITDAQMAIDGFDLDWFFNQ